VRAALRTIAAWTAFAVAALAAGLFAVLVMATSGGGQ
jgi:hypothetical protein